MLFYTHTHSRKKQKEINISNVFYETKRLIGRKYNDEFVKKCYELLSYDIVMNERECISFKTHNNKLITPEEISAEILIKIKQKELQKLIDQINKQKSLSIDELIAQVETHYKFQIDIYKTSVTRFFTYLKLIKDAKSNKKD